MMQMEPIGCINSLFTYKNGTPRQFGICQHARGSLTVQKTVFNNPEHSLDGLESYSHVWIIFIFHKNNNHYTKAKVKPPRLNGKRVGLFSTRCPYRPNPIGLTLAKLDKVEGATIHLSGIDLLDGTPVLDIKPYIPDYDCPQPETLTNVETDMEKLDIASAENFISKGENFMSGVPTIESETLKNDGQDMRTVFHELESDGSVSCGQRVPNMKSPTVMPDGEDMMTDSNVLKPDNSILGGQCVPGTESATVESNVQSMRTGCNVLGSNDSVMVGQHIQNCTNTDTDRCGLSKEGLKPESTNVLVEQMLTDSHFKKDKDLSKNCVNVNSDTGVCRNLHKTSCESNPTCEETTLQVNKIQNLSTENKDFEDVGLHFNEKCKNSIVSDLNAIKTETAKWVKQPPINKLNVRFTQHAEKQLIEFRQNTDDVDYRLQYLNGIDETKSAICDILKEDPRSVYRRKKCEDSLYYFTVDVVHVTCWFDGDVAEVLRIKPVAHVALFNKDKS